MAGLGPRKSFIKDATTTTNYSNYLHTQTMDFRWFLPFSIVCIVYMSTAEIDMKMIRKGNVDAILYNHCIFIKNDIVFDENLFVQTGLKAYGIDKKNKQK